MKFIAYINQTNYGCDYTIACGKTLWEIEAQTEEGALSELKQKIAPSIEEDEPVYELESVVLYEVKNAINVPIEQWYTERARQEEDYKIAQERQKEKLEYKRLKRKYG